MGLSFLACNLCSRFSCPMPYFCFQRRPSRDRGLWRPLEVFFRSKGNVTEVKWSIIFSHHSGWGRNFSPNSYHNLEVPYMVCFAAARAEGEGDYVKPCSLAKLSSWFNIVNQRSAEVISLQNIGERVLAYAELIVSQTSNKLSIPITIVQCLWRFPGSFASNSVLIKLVRENITFLYFRIVYFCRLSNVVFVAWFCLLRQPLGPESCNAPRHHVTPAREAATNHDFAWGSGTGIRRVG